jgi:phosphohistidine phosphatase SixA
MAEITQKKVKNLVKNSPETVNTTLQKENKKIDFIFCSPLLRTKHTAEIVAEKIGFDNKTKGGKIY